MRQNTLLFERLKVAEAMRAFISHRLGDSEELCAKLERVEADLAATQKAVGDRTKALKLVKGEKRAICAEADWLKEKREAIEVKFKGVEQENSQLWREVEELRAGLTAQKKEMEEFQAGFAAQKKELEAGFAVQKKELEVECQKQGDKMYFFGYRCCMKKNDIRHDIPPIPSNDENEILGGPLR